MITVIEALREPNVLQGPPTRRPRSSVVGHMERAVFSLWSLFIENLRSGIARMVVACGASALLIAPREGASFQGLLDWRVWLILVVTTLLVIPSDVIGTLKWRGRGFSSDVVRQRGFDDKLFGSLSAISNLAVVGWILGGLADGSLVRISYFDDIISCES